MATTFSNRHTLFDAEPAASATASDRLRSTVGTSTAGGSGDASPGRSGVSGFQAGSLSGLVDVLAAVSVDGLTEPELSGLLGVARRVQNASAGLVYRIAAEADRLAAAGKAAPSQDFLGENGKSRASTSRQDSQRSKTATSLPGVGDAAGRGDIGSDQIDSLTRRLKGLSDEERSRIDFEGLLKKAKTMPVDRFDKLLRETVERLRTERGKKEAAAKRQASGFRHWFDHKTGVGKFSGQLDALRYEAFTTAIDQHVAALAAASKASGASRADVDTDGQAPLAKDSLSKDAALAATALVELVCSSAERSQHLPHVTVVVDADTLAYGPHAEAVTETGNGHQLDTETVKRLCCDAVLQKVLLDDAGVPINVGRKYRTATAHQWTAIRSIYSTCAWAHCDRPLSWCQLHHIDYWHGVNGKPGGRTDLDNLVPLCSTHHHQVHEDGWSIKLAPTRNVCVGRYKNGREKHGRALEIRRPDGQLHNVGDPPTRKPEAQPDPESALDPEAGPSSRPGPDV